MLIPLTEAAVGKGYMRFHAQEDRKIGARLCSLTNVALAGMSRALDHICVEHCLLSPSIQRTVPARTRRSLRAGDGEDRASSTRDSTGIQSRTACALQSGQAARTHPVASIRQ